MSRGALCLCLAVAAATCGYTPALRTKNAGCVHLGQVENRTPYDGVAAALAGALEDALGQRGTPSAGDRCAAVYVRVFSLDAAPATAADSPEKFVAVRRWRVHALYWVTPDDERDARPVVAQVEVPTGARWEQDPLFDTAGVRAAAQRAAEMIAAEVAARNRRDEGRGRPSTQ